MTSWEEAEKSFEAADESLAKGEMEKARVLFQRSQTAVSFWMAETLEAFRLRMLQIIGELPPEIPTGEPTGGK